MKKLITLCLMLLGVAAQAQNFVVPTSDSTTVRRNVVRGNAANWGLYMNSDNLWITGLSKSYRIRIDSTISTFSRITVSSSATLPTSTSIGSVSSTELTYLDGASSNIQTQINTKAPIVNPTFTGTVSLPSTTSIGSVSSTELGYIDGLTANAQTQINQNSPINSNLLEISDNFNRVNSAYFGNDMLSNYPWVEKGNGYITTNTSGRIEDKKFVADEGTIVYIQNKTKNNITRIGMRASFLASSGSQINGVAMAITPDSSINNLTIHFISNTISWALQTRVGGGSFVTVCGGTYPTELSKDGTVYSFEVVLDGTEARVNSAGISAYGYSSVFTSAPAKYCFFEHYYPPTYAHYNTISTIHQVWAGQAQSFRLLPQKNIDLVGASADPYLKIQNTGTNGRTYQIFSSDNSVGVLGTGNLAFYDSGTSTTRMVIQGVTGNVGINSLNPNAKLEVGGDIAAKQIKSIGTGIEPMLSLKSVGTSGRDYQLISTDNSVGILGTGNLTFYDGTAGAARLVIGSTGYVGIGTVAPAVPLEVNGAIVASNLKSIASGYNSTLTLQNSGTGGNSWQFYAGDNSTSLFGSGGNLALYQGGVTRFVVNGSTGNFLLKTTTDVPSSLFTTTSTTQGFLGIPRMTTTQKNTIDSPASALLVFDTTLGKFSFWDGSAWKTLSVD